MHLLTVRELLSRACHDCSGLLLVHKWTTMVCMPIACYEDCAKGFAIHECVGGMQGECASNAIPDEGTGADALKEALTQTTHF